MRELLRPVLALCPALWLAAQGCATEEEITYGDPAKVAGASSAGGGSSTGGSCAPDPSCAVSFKDDIFAPILEAKAKCSASSCHGGGTAGLLMVPGDFDGAYAALTTYELSGDRGRYVVPCDLEASKMLCNMKVDPEAGASTHGKCGSLMPKALLSDPVDDEPVSLEDVETIAQWIQCGAPSN